MYYRYQKGTNVSKGGFTLVESLVAISILLIVIIGPMTIATKGIQSASFANEQTTAVFLAQEAIELVKKKRDNNALQVLVNGSGDTWSWYGTANVALCKTGNGCDIDVSTGNFHECIVASDCKLNMFTGVATNHAYGYDVSAGWIVSPYTRKIFLSEPEAGKVNVKVVVTWNTTLFTTGTRDVTLQMWVYDQYRRFE